MPTTGRKCFVGVDLGTSGVRACAVDEVGNLLAESRSDLPAPLSPAPGHVQQDPDLWWKACLKTLDTLLLSNQLLPQAISIDGTSGTLLLCDRGGSPLGPALMYNDARSTEQALRLGQIAPADTAVHSASSALAKLCYLLETLHPTATHALHQADWIVGMLSGNFGLSDENNALKLGFDPVQRRWPTWIRECPIDASLLPKVLPVGKTVGEVRGQLCKRWQLRKPLRIVSGTTDSNAATLACGIRETGQAATALGSTLVLKVLSDTPVYDARHGIYSHRIGNRWLVGGASNSGGSVLLQFFNKHQLIELSSQIDPKKPTGLDYYPLPSAGERFPLNDSAIKPKLTPRPQDDVIFLQGLLEGIAAIEELGYRKLQELGAPYPREVVSSGGGARNNVWRLIRQQRLGVPVRTAEHTEACYGSALIAAGLAI